MLRELSILLACLNAAGCLFGAEVPDRDAIEARLDQGDLTVLQELVEKLGQNDTRAWQNWWNERKHDPATIRAIAEGRRPPDVVPPPPPPPPFPPHSRRALPQASGPPPESLSSPPPG